MARIAKPWLWKDRKAYYVTIQGVKYRLAEKKAEANAVFRQLMNQAEGADNGSADGIITKFLEWCEKERPDSVVWYRQFLEPFRETIGALRVEDVQPEHVTKFIDKATWGPAAKRGAITAIKRAFNWAVKEGKIARNPVKSVEKPEAPTREVVITRKEHDRIVQNVSKPFGELLELAWETGARPFELYRLETRHVDLKGCRAVYAKLESKGKRRQRVLYFSKKAMKIIKRNVREEGAVMRNVDGNPWTVHSINSAFARVAKKLKTPRRCLYNWRHSFAHRKLSEGTDSLILATLMSHSSVEMLHRVYAHVHQNQGLLLAALNK